MKHGWWLLGCWCGWLSSAPLTLVTGPSATDASAASTAARSRPVCTRSAVVAITSRPVCTRSAAVATAACGGGGGSSAPAPEEVKALAGDEQIFVEWKEITGVQYWLWFKEGASVAVGDKNATAKVGSKGGGIDSPYLIDTVRTGTALTNGTAY